VVSYLWRPRYFTRASIQLPWNGDDDQLEQMCSPSYFLLLEPRLNEHAHPTLNAAYIRFSQEFLVLRSSLLPQTIHPCECMRRAENLASAENITPGLALFPSRSPHKAIHPQRLPRRDLRNENPAFAENFPRLFPYILLPHSHPFKFI
jgi:hypothetical protein